MKEGHYTILNGIRDYLIGNQKELLDSPLQIPFSEEKFDGITDLFNFFKNGLPTILESSAVISMTVYYFFNPNSNLLIADLIAAADVISREQGFEKTNTYAYGLVGRIRDAYKTLSKNYSKKP